MRVEVDTVVAAPRALVWERLVDWERQAEWMVDARAVEVLSDHRAGIGVELRCPTRIFGFTVVDLLRVTWWDDGYRLAVRHTGRLIRGDAAFELDDADGGTSVVWWEDVVAPLGAVGELVGDLVVGPYVALVFRRSLNSFKQLCEREHAESRR